MLDEEQVSLKIAQTIARFPWYGRLIADAGIDPHDADSIRKLPLITSELLERHYYDAENPLGDTIPYAAYRTSGTSSSRRKTIYYSAEDEENYASIKAELFRPFLESPDIRTVLSDMGTGHAANTAVAIFERIGLQAESIAFQQPIEEHLERLLAYRPHVLYTMPSIMDHLLSAWPGDPQAFGIRKVILVGEIASPAWIRTVADRLGIGVTDIMDTYGSIEMGTIAFFSHAHGRYLLTEGLEGQGIPADLITGEPDSLREGEDVLVLTSAVRELFPSLRYVTYDVVRDLRPILVDGKWRQSFAGVVRRIGTELKHGEKISVYDIENIVFRHLKQALVRIQVQDNKLAVHIDCDEADPEAFEKIERELMDGIPEIGVMIRNKMLDKLRVVPAKISYDRSKTKHKKVFYD